MKKKSHIALTLLNDFEKLVGDFFKFCGLLTISEPCYDDIGNHPKISIKIVLFVCIKRFNLNKTVVGDFFQILRPSHNIKTQM